MSSASSSAVKSLWHPSLGAWPSEDGVCFRVWAPKAARIEVVFENTGRSPVPLAGPTDGYFSGLAAAARAGDRYRYRIDGKDAFPDPASRFQPEGVHGPSQIVDASHFPWSDREWKGIPAVSRAIYELHIGTFTPEGTYAAAAKKLASLAQLGVTVIELMPVADFPGSRNWGYDGVFPYAPARAYGTPDDLRRFVDAAHAAGLAVAMDVVYNHLGPDGNYTGVYSPYYFTHRHRSPWGDGINFDGEHSRPVRDFFLENALYWIHDFHLDGLRLDATHAITDDSGDHFVKELARVVHAARPAPRPFLIAEDHRNWASMVRPRAAGGWELDGVWADDFHHIARRFLAGDHESYYADFRPDLRDLSTAIRDGWLYSGQHSKHMGHDRGTPSTGISYDHFVIFIQNHDQVGNRAFGERLHHQIDPAEYRALSALWLAAPETPLLFMGQEWSATSPFLFFTDHAPELGKKVSAGRRAEFKTFSAFADANLRSKIPDPQDEATFAESRLRWDELEKPEHAAVRALYSRLLRLRRETSALQNVDRGATVVGAIGEDAVALLRKGDEPVLALARLRGAGALSLMDSALAPEIRDRQWDLSLSTEDPSFALEAKPVGIGDGPFGEIIFQRPGAVIWKGRCRG